MTTCNSQNGSTPQLNNVHFGRCVLLFRYGSLHLTTSGCFQEAEKIDHTSCYGGKRNTDNVKLLSSIYQVDQVSPLNIYCWRSLWLVVGTGCQSNDITIYFPNSFGDGSLLVGPPSMPRLIMLSSCLLYPVGLGLPHSAPVCIVTSSWPKQGCDIPMS